MRFAKIRIPMFGLDPVYACFRPKPCLLPFGSMLAFMSDITENLVKGRIKILRKHANVFAEGRIMFCQGTLEFDGAMLSHKTRPQPL